MRSGIPIRAGTPRWLVAVLATSAALVLVAIGAGSALLLNGDGAPPDALTARPGPVDIGFTQDMSVHHSQAIAMADIVSANPDPTLRALAHGIRTAQLEQLGRMQGFLTLWRQPGLPAGPPMTWMTDHPSDHAGRHSASTAALGGMPGLATQDQLQQLRELSGEEQTSLFLRLMLRHHDGGIAMAATAAHSAAVPEVQALARLMVVDQQRENEVMSQLLLRRGTDPRRVLPRTR